MNEIFADCPIHGVFQSEPFFTAGPGIVLEVKGTTISCPLCQSSSSVIDSVYDHSHPPTPKVTLYPTPAQLVRLKTALAWAEEALANDHVDREEVERKVRLAAQKEAPQLTSLVDRVFGTKGAGVAAWVAVMLTVLQMLTNSNPPELTPEFIEQVIEQVQKHSEDDESTSPTQPAPKQTQEPRPPEELVIVKT